MSGGSLDYFYSELADHVGDFGDKELDELVADLAQLFHDREWYLSSDTNEGTWREARDAFKKKWFGDGMRAVRFEKYIADIRNEIIEMLGTSDRRCWNCKKWTPEKDPASPYGDCDVITGCLMHRSENCEKFEPRDAK